MHTRTIRREMTPLFKAGDGSPGSTTSADTVKTTETRAHSGEAEYSPTAYDDAFRTMVNDCPELLLPLLNEMFEESYQGHEVIEFTPNEHFLNQQDGRSRKIVTDTTFRVVGTTTRTYHLECQSTEDERLLIRFFEYDAQIALDQSRQITNHEILVTFPHTGLLALRNSAGTPDSMRITLQTREGRIGYDVPVVKIQDYRLEDIFEKKLLFLIPFFLFTRESQFAELEQNERKLAALKQEYLRIRQYLEQRVQEGSISEFTNRAIWENTVHVMELLSKKYKTIRKELRPVMVGRVLDYEAKRIRDKGILIGEQRGIVIGEQRGIAIGEQRGIAIGEQRGIQKGRILEYIDVCKTELQLHDEEILTKIMARFQLDETEAREYFRQVTMS